jgi:hypothetical protein
MHLWILSTHTTSSAITSRTVPCMIRNACWTVTQILIRSRSIRRFGHFKSVMILRARLFSCSKQVWKLRYSLRWTFTLWFWKLWRDRIKEISDFNHGNSKSRSSLLQCIAAGHQRVSASRRAKDYKTHRWSKYHRDYIQISCSLCLRNSIQCFDVECWRWNSQYFPFRGLRSKFQGHCNNKSTQIRAGKTVTINRSPLLLIV